MFSIEKDRVFMQDETGKTIAEVDRRACKILEGKDNVPLLGVSNHNLSEIKQANEILKAHGLKLSAVQNHYSLINRSSEDSGILDYCKDNDIHFFAYMVLEQGALSGKYDTQHPMPEGSARAETYNPVLDKLEVLTAELERIADSLEINVVRFWEKEMK